jgi:hypothetical protein
MTQNTNKSITQTRLASLESLDIYKYYKNSPYLSLKHASYFYTYSEIFEPYRNKKITFVEVGVLNGGSLFMWREYFGKKVRIIGIDLNPEAKKWEKDGFEIYIGDQSQESFWNEFFANTGPVDIILDDGGHTYIQQITTSHCAIPHINDGGVIVVEDTHTSYLKEFGYPTKYSFISWTKTLIDNINGRFPSIHNQTLNYKNYIYSIQNFESIVCLKINKALCFENFHTSNNGTTSNAADFRYKNTFLGKIKKNILDKYAFLNKIPGIEFIKLFITKHYNNYITSKYTRKYFE